MKPANAAYVTNSDRTAERAADAQHQRASGDLPQPEGRHGPTRGREAGGAQRSRRGIRVYQFRSPADEQQRRGEVAPSDCEHRPKG